MSQEQLPKGWQGESAESLHKKLRDMDPGRATGEVIGPIEDAYNWQRNSEVGEFFAGGDDDPSATNKSTTLRKANTGV